MDTGWAQVLLTVGSMVFIGGITIGVLRIQGEEMRRRMGDMEAEMKQMTQVLINQATQTVRLDTMDERLTLQGKRLDGTIEDFHKGQSNLARMVEGCVSRMNSFMDNLAREMMDRKDGQRKLIDG